MAERNLLCIEPDGATVAQIRSALEPYGFGVESIPNGDDAIEWGRAHPTSLIILSVEPRKVGYAVCNKLKRSPALRDVPLILISAEETLATFEQPGGGWVGSVCRTRSPTWPWPCCPTGT